MIKTQEMVEEKRGRELERKNVTVYFWRRDTTSKINIHVCMYCTWYGTGNTR